jgi:hypothetical protein
MTTTGWPLVDQAQAVLREHGHESLADELTRLVESERQARQAAEVNLHAVWQLQDKYEPKRKGDSYVNWTGD